MHLLHLSNRMLDKYRIFHQVCSRFTGTTDRKDKVFTFLVEPDNNAQEQITARFSAQLSFIRTFQPQIALVDINMPILNGLELAQKVSSARTRSSSSCLMWCRRMPMYAMR